jgi:hypothetical protein
MGTPGSKVDFVCAGDILVAHGVDPAHVEHVYPAALRYPLSRILATIAALKDIQAVPTRTPPIRPINIDENPPEHPDVVPDAGASRLVALHPPILAFPPDALRAKASALRLLGLDARKVVRRCPSVFGFSDKRIRNTLAYLRSIGLDGVCVVNNYPSVLCFTATKLRAVTVFVTVEMGRDVRELQRYPSCFGCSVDRRLRTRHDFAKFCNKPNATLRTLVYRTDTGFARAMGQPLENYHRWLSQRLRC